MRPVHILGALLIAISITLTGGALTAPHTAHSADTPISPKCQALNDPAFDATYQNNSSAVAGEIWAGEVITITATGGGTGPPIFMSLSFPTQLLASGTVPGTMTYVVPQTQSPAYIAWGADNGTPTWTVDCFAPGCDALMAMTPNAVVGRFVADAPTYWTPGKLIVPHVTIPAEKTAWVLGMNASGDYYKIIWACDMLWVPVSSMGPNVGDPVWDGAPLPTDVVE